MEPRPNHLRLVRPQRENIGEASLPERGDLALMSALLAVNLVPILGEVAGVGRWSAGTVGLATACALLATRELWLEVRALVRARRVRAS